VGVGLGVDIAQETRHTAEASNKTNNQKPITNPKSQPCTGWVATPIPLPHTGLVANPQLTQVPWEFQVRSRIASDQISICDQASNFDLRSSQQFRFAIKLAISICDQASNLDRV
jgi:hypothetical protein